MPTTNTLPFTTSKRRMGEPNHHNEKSHQLTPKIYPRRYFDAAPTWFIWNKLTAADLHALSTERGFEGQKIYFYHNHPIQLVSVVGLVVDINSFADGRFTVLTLDDGSGKCLEVKIKRRQPGKEGEAEAPWNSETEKVDVSIRMALPVVHLDGKPIEIGDVVRAKGGIDTYVRPKGGIDIYHEVRQLELKRLFVVPDTNAEARFWLETAQWKGKVLSRPWVLTQAVRDKMDEKVGQEQKAEREKARKKREWTIQISDRRRAYDEKQEAKRKAKEVEFSAGALKGSNVILAPWE